MSTVQNVAATPVAVASPLAMGAAPAPDASTLLIPPVAPLVDIQDGLIIVYALQTELSASSVRDAATEAAGKDAASKAQLEAFEAAMKRQADARRKTQGFWADLKKVASTIAKIAGVVAGVASIALSGGTTVALAVAVAGVSLSAGGTAVRELKLLGKDSDSVGMWMELGGAGIALGGAALGALGVTALSVKGGSTLMEGVRLGGAITSATGTATAAGAGIVIADAQRDADHAAADRQAAEFAMERLRFERDLILRAAEQSAEATKDALTATRTAIEACSNVTDVGIMGVRA